MRTTTIVIAILAFLGATISGAFNSQICIPCLAVVLGAAAGYLVCRSERPADRNSATRLGATAGGLAGAGTLLGSVAGGLIGALILGPQGAESQMESIAKAMGITVPAGPVSPVTYYGTALGVSGCCGVGEVAIMVLLGALAAMVWFQMTRGDVAAAGNS